MGKIEIREIEAKSAIVKSSLPDSDYVVNPYIGCAFACAYCYANFMGRFHGYAIDDWGKYVLVKKNAPTLFAKEISGKAFRSENPPSILFSSVTDPYQPVEKEYEMTRTMLCTAADVGYRGKISILTKSPLVIRDMDVIRRLPSVTVGLTFNTTDVNVKRAFEKFTPGDESRLKSLAAFNAAGIATYAFVGPIFPQVYEDPKQLTETLRAIKDVGTLNVYIEHLNLNSRIKHRLDELQGTITNKTSAEESKRFDEYVASMSENLGLRILLGEPIKHNKTKK